MSPDKDLVDQLRAGDRRALAKAITLVESQNPDHQYAKADLLDQLRSSAPDFEIRSPARRLGISGTPGVGKSTLIEALGTRLIDQGRRVAVLAVDPSSAISRGSILGDKTRMPKLATSAQAYVRPSPARGGLGGITSGTAAAITCCEAAGFDRIIVETVGVGQSETAVAGVTDLFLLLHSPGTGDELQGIKRGVMELADRVAVTKADGELLPAARRAQAELRSALHLMRPKPGREMTEVDLVSALTGDGLDELLAALDSEHAELTRTGELKEIRHRQALEQFESALTDGILSNHLQTGPQETCAEIRIGVSTGSLAPLAGAIRCLGQRQAPTEINAITLGVTNMKRSIDFYSSLGLIPEFRADDDSFATLAHGENFVNLEHNSDPHTRWGRVILFVPDPDATHARAIAAGHRPESTPEDAPWGERYFHLRDPDGHELSFARRL